ncbi:ribonuclease P protein component [Leucobacter insecticola]|nr:ribonuclease P protein component [Leucobacter insecticola]
MRSGRRVGGALCITHAVFHVSDHPARFGYIVSKAVGNAVVRNRVRRRLKAITEGHINAGFSGADIVFRALPASAAATFLDLDKEVSRALAKLQSESVRA